MRKSHMINYTNTLIRQNSSLELINSFMIKCKTFLRNLSNFEDKRDILQEI